MTAGACYQETHNLSPAELVAQVFIDFNTIVVRDGVDLRAAHKAFLKIDEYRRSISPDTPGAEPEDGA
jgi:hypothetical protein